MAPSKKIIKNKSKNNFEFLKHFGIEKKKKKNAEKNISKVFKSACDLEEKLSLEMKMKEGTTRLLAACRHTDQTLAAVKSLLTSDIRLAAYRTELHRRAINRPTAETPSAIKVEPSLATVAISNLRMPLIWKGTDHFKNRGDYRRFAVFCILRVGTEIYDTVLANTVDRSMTDISFDDAIIFHDVPPDFELRMEVYSCLLQNDLSIASTPRKLKKRISSSLSRTLGRKAAAGLSGERFDLVARASLKLADSSPEPHAHDLLLENLENAHHQLPLFGYFCCRLAVRPHCLEGQRLTGPLLLVERSGRVTTNTKVWACLEGSDLNIWHSAGSPDGEPLVTVPINKELQLRCSDRHLRLIFSAREVVLAADSDLDLASWQAYLRQHVQDLASWGAAARQLMDIPSPTIGTAGFVDRSGSLYEQIPVKAVSCSQSSLALSSQSWSPPLLRSRSSSISSGHRRRTLPRLFFR